jgi:flagellar hook-associated protein 1 FlgK
MESTPPELTSIGPVGTGVTVRKVESIRDQFLELRISQSNQNVGQQDTVSSYLDQVESVFDPNESGVQDALTGFFNSFTALATDATSSSLRYGVISASQNLATSFRDASQRLTEIRDNANAAVVDTVREINTLTATIAKLNTQISAAEASGPEAGALRDQRSVALNQLAQDIDIHYFEADDGTLTIATAGGTNLVTGGSPQTLDTVSTGPAGLFRVKAGSYDITDSIQSGKLGGLFEVRDKLIPAYQNQLDTLAESVISHVNSTQTAGTDLQSPPTSPTLNLFNPVATTAGAAAAFSVNSAVAADPRYIAAGKSGAPGDNANALDLAALSFQKFLASGTETFSEGMGSLQFKVGADSQSAKDQLGTNQAILTQLENSRDAVSGVSLDDEAIDLMRFQRAYQAAAKYISVIDGLTGELIDKLGS